MTETLKLFTAAQIARASGFTRQGVAVGLETVLPTGSVDVDGRPAAAWSFSSVPTDWQLEMTRRGVKRGFENGEAYLLSIPAVPWKAPLPWDKVPERERLKADKLHKAMAQPLELYAEGTRGAELERAGMAAYQAEFGYPLKDARHWRRLFNRTLERDGGEENWQRLEIYLDDRAFAVSRTPRHIIADEHRHRDLAQVFASLDNRTNPTAEDRAVLWDAVFTHFEKLTAELPDDAAGARERKTCKASLLLYLHQAFPDGTLCGSAASLRRRFEEKLNTWRAHDRCPAALNDNRHLKSGKFRGSEFQKDYDAIRDLAILHDGNIAIAHRLLREQGKLSPEFCAHYAFDVRSAKSEVPAAVRDAIAPQVEMCLPLRRGPWQARMRGPYIKRDWSEVAPGDWFCADDVTWNHYFREQLPDGRWRLLRGECLLMTDLRTGNPLDFLLIAGHYNGEHVRTLALKVHDRVGLPRKGFYFERGVWCSRLVVGDNRQGTPVHWREAENGLCAQGLKLEVRHATTPRAKPIEGLLRIIQERMRSIPGFIGFNERTDEREREQILIAMANHGDAESLRQFPTQAQWADTIRAVLESFAREPQNGDMLNGAAPAEAWSREVSARPLRQLWEDSRYILSTHRKEITVHQEGIVLTIRGQKRVYYNEHTGRFIGQRVFAFYNLEMPELLTVSDMDRTQYFTVRAVQLPAMSATREQLAEVNRLRNAHMAPAKAIFGGIKHDVVSTISRDNEHGEQEKELGRFHNAEMAKTKENDTRRDRTLRKARVKAAASGFSVGAGVRNPERVLTGVERAAEYRRRITQKEQESNHHG